MASLTCDVRTRARSLQSASSESEAGYRPSSRETASRRRLAPGDRSEALAPAARLERPPLNDVAVGDIFRPVADFPHIVYSKTRTDLTTT